MLANKQIYLAFKISSYQECSWSSYTR